MFTEIETDVLLEEIAQGDELYESDANRAVSYTHLELPRRSPEKILHFRQYRHCPVPGKRNNL